MICQEIYSHLVLASIRNEALPVFPRRHLFTLIDVVLGIGNGIDHRQVKPPAGLLAVLPSAVYICLGAVGELERGGQPLADAPHAYLHGSIGVINLAKGIGIELVVVLVVELEALHSGQLTWIVVVLTLDVRLVDGNRGVALQLQEDAMAVIGLRLDGFAWKHQQR